MAYRLLPVRKPADLQDLVDTEQMYENVTTKMRFRGLDNPKANLNEDYRGFVQNHRSMITTLADALIMEGDSVRAKEILDLGMEKMPVEAVPYDVSSIGYVQGYLDLGETEKAREMGLAIANQFSEEIIPAEKQRFDFAFRAKMRGLQYLA